MPRITILIATLALLFGCKHEPVVEKPSTQDNQGTKYASRTPQLRHAVLELFGGVISGSDPIGHQTARQIKLDHPNLTHVIRVDAGPFSRPQSKYPDFRTPFGDSLLKRSGAVAFPAGTVNRATYFGKSMSGSSAAMMQQFWESTITAVISQTSGLNIGGEAEYDKNSRRLTIELELYYIRDDLRSNQLHLALTESNIMQPQVGGGSNYNHDFVLCDLLTGLEGHEILEDRTKGASIRRQYDFTLPTTFNYNADGNGLDPKPHNFELIAFVTQDHGRIETAVEIPITIK
jgi:hypothetical protein